MSWYAKIKTAESRDPIEYIKYDPDLYGWTMFVKYTENGKVYTYKNVSPFIYDKIRKLRYNKNYSKAIEILRNLSKNSESEDKPSSENKPDSAKVQKAPQQLKLF